MEVSPLKKGTEVVPNYANLLRKLLTGEMRQEAWDMRHGRGGLGQEEGDIRHRKGDVRKEMRGRRKETEEGRQKTGDESSDVNDHKITLVIKLSY